MKRNNINFGFGFVFLVFVMALGVPKKINGQNWVSDDNNFETNWNVSIQLGQAVLLNEVNYNLRASSVDMNNLADWGFCVQLAKMAWERFDIGVEFGVSNFKGFKNNSSNINWLNLHPQFNNEKYNFEPYALYYDSDFTNFTLFAKYNFVNFSTFSQGYIKLNLYLKLGFGVILPSVEMGYKNLANYEFTGLSHPLFLKGRYPLPKKDPHFIFHPGSGLNYQLTDRIFITAEASFQLLGTNYIDGVLNYNNLLAPDTPMGSIPDYKVPVFSVTGRLVAGLSYFFNFDSKRQERIKYMPFYDHRYRSYYSKYQTSSTKKARKQNLPFFNIDFSKD